MADTWTFDAPSGTYKSHNMSRDLRTAAIARTVVMPFVGLEDGSGKRKGETVTISRVSNINVPANARLSELEKVPEDSITMSTTSITMVEWGRSVPFTDLRIQLDKFDPQQKVQKQLMNQMKLVLDNAAAETMTSSSVKIKAIPTGEGSLTFDTDGVASTSATVNMNFFHLERMRDFAVDTILAPAYYDNGDYAYIGTTQALRGLKDDPKFESWNKHNHPEKMSNSELGRIEQTRLVESNNSGAFTKNLGTNANLGEGIFFGDDFVTMVVAEDPELVVQINKGQDYGRQHGVAWLGTFEFGIPWDTATAGEARGIHVTSS